MQRYFILTLLILVNCAGTSRKDHVPDSGTQGEEAADLVRGFLVWYKGNYGNISSIALVPEAYDRDTSNVYHLSRRNLKEYLKVLRSSGMLSENFLIDLEKKISTCGDEIEAMKIKDGPPGCLENDQVLLTLEIEETLVRIEDLKILSTTFGNSKSHAVVDVQLIYKLRFTLISDGKSWLIDSIESIGA